MSNTEPKFPDVEVQLSGEDGNPFFIVARTSKAMKAAGHGDAVEQYREEAMSGNYDHVLQTTMLYVTTY